jgi:hypothetical protein
MTGERGWMLQVLSGLILVLAASAAAVDLDEALEDAPQEILDIIEAAQGPLSEGDFLIIGRVSFTDGRPIEGGDCPEVYVPYLRGIDRSLAVFPDGWFATDRPIESYYAGDGVLVLRAMGHHPVDIPIAVGDPIVLVGASVLVPSGLHKITGVVLDPDGGPVPGLTVDLTFPLASRCYDPLRSTITDEAGRFGFTGLSSAQHRVGLAAPHGYVDARLDVLPYGPDADEVVELTMHPKLRIVVDYAYQPNGTRMLSGPDLITGTATWEAWVEGFDFEDGGSEYFEEEDLRDLELEQSGGELLFRAFYVTGENGFYRVSDASFDDVTVAAEAGYGISRAPCVAGGVYVVRTHTENHYARFIVRAIEPVS